MNERAPEAPQLRGLRIAVVLESLEIGGAERQALYLAAYLKRERGAHVEVLGLTRSGPAAAICEKEGLAWRSLGLSWPSHRVGYVKVLAVAGLALRRAAPDVIMPYTILPNLVCGLLWKSVGARLCLWNQREEGRGRTASLPVRIAISRTPGFLANSQGGADFLTRTLGVAPGRIQIIHNGVELPAAADRAAVRAGLAISLERPAACMVANLHAHKDHATLLKAWRLVLDSGTWGAHPPLLLLAGRFDETAPALRALATESGLDGNVMFLGQVRDVPALLQSVDLGVYSSRSEGNPNGVLEPMAAGLAVAGTDIPAIREVVGDAGRPYLAPPGDASALAERIRVLLTDDDLRARAGAANRARAASAFSMRGMCENTARAIEAGLRAAKT